jgi:hypothetical protein
MDDIKNAVLALNVQKNIYLLASYATVSWIGKTLHDSMPQVSERHRANATRWLARAEVQHDTL